MEDKIRDVTKKEKRVEMVMARINELKEVINVLECIAANPDIGEKKILDEMGVDFSLYRRFVYDLDWSSKLSPSTRKAIQAERREAFPTACWQEVLWLDIIADRFSIGELQCAPTDTVETVDYMISTLKDREQDVIHMRYRDGMTQAEVGEVLGVSHGRVGQIQANAMRKLIYRYARLRLGNGQFGTIVGMQRRMEEDMEVKIKYEIIQMLNDTFTDLKDLIATAHKIIEDNEFAKRRQEIRDGGDIPLEDLDLSIRTFNCLKRAGFKSLKDFRNGTRASELMGIKNIGWKAYEELRQKLDSLGILIIDDIYGE